MESWHIIVDILILLCGAFLTGLLFERLRQNAILGYLVAGFLLGPPVLNLISDHEAIEAIAELGVALLLFMIGLEFSWSKLKRMSITYLWIGILQIVISIGIVTLISIALGINSRTSLTLGLIFALSSTALVLRVLSERRELDSIHGRISLSILLLQDIALVPMVLVVSGLGEGALNVSMLLGLGRSALYIVCFFTALYFFNRYVLKKLLDLSAGSRNYELLFLLAIIIALGSAWIAMKIGLSPGLGAFVAGMLVAESPFATQVRADIGALKTLFMTLFFTSIGMLANTSWIASNWAVTLGLVAAILAGKSFIVWISGLILTRTGRHPLAAGISIAQVGEFSFLLTAIAFGNGLLDSHLYQLVISSTIITMMLTPFLVSRSLNLTDSLRRLFKRSGQVAHDEKTDFKESVSCQVLLIGFGPSGKSVWMIMQKRGITTSLIELNHQTVADAKRMGIHAVFGDASQEITLREANVESALLVVITVPDPRMAKEIITCVRSIAPHVPIIARSRYQIYSDELLQAGAAVVIDEEEEIGHQLSEQAIKHLKMECPK